MPVSFEELDGSPTFRVSDGQVAATRAFKLAWADRFEFVNEVWGYWLFIGSTLTHVPPIQFPGLPGCFVDDVRVEPFIPDSPIAGTPTLRSQTNSYDFARVTVLYRYQPQSEDNSGKPNVPDGTFLVYSSDFGAEYLSVPARHWKWDVDDDPLADDVNPGILIPTEDLQLTWLRVPRPPWTKIRELRGRTNSGAFMNHNVGTVLFLGARARREYQVSASAPTPLWRLDYHFKVREIRQTKVPNALVGWNYFHRQKAAGGEHWLKVVDESDVPPFPETADFSQLFEFGS